MEIQLNTLSDIPDSELNGNKATFAQNGNTNDPAMARIQVDKDVGSIQQELSNKWEQTVTLIKKRVKISLLIGLAVAYLAYFSYAMYCEFGDEGSIRLLVCTIFGVFYISWTFLLKNEDASEKWADLVDGIARVYSDGNRPKFVRWSMYIVSSIGCVVYIVMNVGLTSPGKLRSLLGMFVLILFMVLISNNKRKIKWYTVYWGFVFQFLLGVFVLKLEAGRGAINWAAERLEGYMAMSKSGSIFLFGPNYLDHPFAFGTIPQIIMFCATIQVLVYIGTIPFLVRTCGRLVAFLFDVSAPEAMNATANILLGGPESAMIIRNYMRDMPTSQLFTVMTNGGSTCGGAALIQIIGFGIQAEYLLSASIMSVPAALVCAKIMIPDDNTMDANKDQESTTKESHKQVEDKGESERGKPDKFPEPKGVIQALLMGTKIGLALCANIIGIMIVFNAMVDMLDSTVEWFGDRVNVEITMKMILGYVFFPIAYIIGVDVRDCKRGGELLGIKILTNPILGYIALGDLRENRETFEDYSIAYNGTDWSYQGQDIHLTNWNQTLTDGYITERSEAVLTYALCGFACLTSLGASLGALAALIPGRTNDISRLAVPSLIGGVISSFLTACVAGLEK